MSVQTEMVQAIPEVQVHRASGHGIGMSSGGKVVILVDNSPSAMIKLPTSIFDMIEEANDYYFPTLTSVYLKISRTLINLMTIFLTPVFLLFMQNLNWLPKVFAFVAVKDTVNIPLIYQLLMLEVAIDGLEACGTEYAKYVKHPLSVIAGIVMGEFSVASGWFNSEVMLYMAFVAVANYTQPNFLNLVMFKIHASGITGIDRII